MENNWNSVLTIKSKKKKSVAKSQNGHTMFQTKPPSTKLTGSAVPSCLSDHEPMELKDINGNDKFVQFGDVKEEIVENVEEEIRLVREMLLSAEKYMDVNLNIVQTFFVQFVISATFCSF